MNFIKQIVTYLFPPKKIFVSPTQVNQSPVRSALAESEEDPAFAPIRDFVEAKKYEDSVAIFEGDYGGQIYIVAPLSEIECTEKDLNRLLEVIDLWCWNEPDGQGLYYERKKTGSVVSGGMGGGKVTDSIWFHPELVSLKLEEDISRVIKGHSKELRRPSPGYKRP